MTGNGEKTKPIPRGIDPVRDKHRLVAGRYGTREMCDLWGPETTYEGVMKVQVAGFAALNRLYPGMVPGRHFAVLSDTARLDVVNPDKIRELEERGGHDVIAINTAWEEEVMKRHPGAAAWINAMRTSADSTETAKALQFKKSLEVLADSLENLRDITLEKSKEWREIPYMDQTHLLDALPTVAGRPLSFFAESLQSDLDLIAFVYANSLVAKWGDATANHHASKGRKIDGMKLQEEYAKMLGLRYMDAAAQTPAREYNADVIYAIARSAGTVANLARHVRTGRGSDRSVFRYVKKGKKGSSAMPHKDLSGGNPDTEEQAESIFKIVAGYMSGVLNSIVFDYGRNLVGSALDRIAYDDAFKLTDHAARRMAEIMYKLEIDEQRSTERVKRTYGVTTSAQVMTYLVDPATYDPLPRSKAHELAADLATRAYAEKRQFHDVLLESPEITSRLDPLTILRITDPLAYIGQSKEIVDAVYAKCHGKRTFPNA